MMRFMLSALLAGAALAPHAAEAFWQRSQVSRCSDATTEAERLRLRCWELEPYADPGWPVLGVGAGAYGYRLDGLRPGPGPLPPPPLPPRGATRRLG